MFVRPPDRREFLRLLGRAAAASFTPAWLRGAESSSAEFVRLSILHTTDLHGHIVPTEDYDGSADVGGMARCVTQIRHWRDENPNSLLIDLGDVYQGTACALQDQGRLMIELFNLLRYDAWIVGNHEFDWGIEPFLRALDRSAMPVLAANTLLEGKAPGVFADKRHPFSKIQPLILKEIAGIRLAIIGLATPGMPFWFPPSFLEGVEFLSPIGPTRRAIAQAKSLGADAIVLAGHMGLKERTGGDDFANQVMALTSEFREAAVFIAGHTHQNIPSRVTNGVIFTQADHFGIHVGRTDLIFDRNSRKLLDVQARCEQMDARLALDPVVMSRAQPQLALADAALAQPIGELRETLSVHRSPGEPSELERLIGAAISEALAQRSVHVDGVFHGTFDAQHAFRKGAKTVGDIWRILPFENYLVTGELNSAELKAVMDEVLQSHDPRSLIGFYLSVAGVGRDRRVTNLTLDRRPLDPAKRYRIAFNTFDARSGGHRFMKLRDLLERPETRCTLHPVQTRDALIEYFRRHKAVDRLRPRSGRRAA